MYVMTSSSRSFSLGRVSWAYVRTVNPLRFAVCCGLQRWIPPPFEEIQVVPYAGVPNWCVPSK